MHGRLHVGGGRVSEPERVRPMKRRFLSGAIVLLIGSCGSDEFAIDIGDVVDHPRYAELRRRLAIEIGGESTASGGVCTPALDAVTPCCSPSFCSVRGLSDDIERGCRSELDPQVALNPARVNSTCGRAVIDSEISTCVAQRLLDIVESPSRRDVLAITPFSEFPVQRTLQVGPQDAESNMELAREAVSRLANAQDTAGDALASRTICPLTELAADAGVGALADTTLGDELSHFYVESLLLADEATRHLQTSGAAVSDAQFSRAADRAEVATLRLAPFASRLAAAHQLIGGSHLLPARGINSPDSPGLFTRPALTRDAQRALPDAWRQG